MASYISTSIAPSTKLILNAPKSQCSIRQINLSNLCGSRLGGLRALPTFQISRSLSLSSSYRCLKTTISCSARPETLEIVQTTIAKQLSIDESTVTPQTKFADLGADSLDTVEIMMALEEGFGVSIGEGGAENVVTVQDAADLIEKVIAESS